MTENPPTIDLPSDLSFAADVAEILRSHSGRAEAARQVLPGFLKTLGAQSASLVAQQHGHWQIEAQSSEARSSAHSVRDGLGSSIGSLPMDLVSEAVDQGNAQTDGVSWAIPCQVDISNGNNIVTSPIVSCLVVQFGDANPAPSRINQIGPLFVSALARCELDSRHRHRIGQLASVLEAAAKWQQTQLQSDRDDTALLRHIADTATELVNCQRASIFLWDRRRKKLIGKPALGINEGPLEVPDDAGIVGEVLASSEPQIWNANSDDESRVNREIDRSLEFDTHSLVAVPLIGSRGNTIGVFEAINHNRNRFDSSHVLLLKDLAAHAAVAIEAHQKQRSLTESRDRLVDDAASNTPMIGEHPAIESIRQTGSKVAQTELTVLILGSNGTGKEIVARHVHYESDRRSGPFIAVNCAALVESLLESELFGHEKGSFTDASTTRVGKFELANGGTLFLDEIGDMSLGGQAKLLRVLEQKEVVRVGGSTPIPVDVRVIAATNQPLESLIAEKRFREDLFFRLNVVSLHLPDLADRGRDILMLAEHFLQHFCYEIGRKVPMLSESAQTALLSHDWPGNVRELRNTIERVVYLTSGTVINAPDLELRNNRNIQAGPTSGGSSSYSTDLPPSLAEATRRFQIDHIRGAIDKCGGNMTEAASQLDLHRSNLYRKMKQLEMKTGDEDTAEEHPPN